MNDLSDGADRPVFPDETMDGAEERPPRARSSILRLMMAVAVVAILLAAGQGLNGIVLVFALAFLALFGVRWVLLRGQREIATLGFWVLAVFANVLYVAACIAPDSTYFGILLLGWLVIVMPAIIGQGMSWANGSLRGNVLLNRSRRTAVVSVIFLAVLPVLTLLTSWPLHLTFLIARPSLESLADRIDAGGAVVAPVRVGLLQIVDSAVAPMTGNVGLIIKRARHGSRGLVRVRPGTPPDVRGPIDGSRLDVPLGEGWWYRQED
jgi:hypothetical protein